MISGEQIALKLKKFFIKDDKNKKKVKAKTVKKKVTKKVAPVKSIKKSPKKLVKKDIKKAVKKKANKNAKEVEKKERYIKAPKVLKKFLGNPILEPDFQSVWESKAVFNPAAICVGGKVHLVYRAIGDNDVSVLGYAVSEDGLTIDEKAVEPIYAPDRTIVAKHKRKRSKALCESGGSWGGGCEDPRLTVIDEAVYMIYTAFDGWGSLRLMMASIDLDDFCRQRWNWGKPVHISPPGQIHKNWVLFPEKVNGKYAILHNVYPNVEIDFFDSLDDLDGEYHICSAFKGREKRDGHWDTWVRGAGATPIKTDHGWLLFYHAMDERDPNKYKIGAMILDSDDPTKIVYRSKTPVLEPDEFYENAGHKVGVVYSCGAVVTENNQLLVYYGGADTVVCVAQADLTDFIEKIFAGEQPQFKKSKVKNIIKNKKVSKEAISNGRKRK